MEIIRVVDTPNGVILEVILDGGNKTWIRCDEDFKIKSKHVNVAGCQNYIFQYFGVNPS